MLAPRLTREAIFSALTACYPSQSRDQLKSSLIGIFQQLVHYNGELLVCKNCDKSGKACRCPDHGVLTEGGWRNRNIHAWYQTETWLIDSSKLMAVTADDLTATLASKRLLEIIAYFKQL